nr:hypothetical protein [Actinoplanes solisilvae]
MTSLRTYVRSNGGNWLIISVLRPERTTTEVDRAEITEWLTGWALKGAEVVDTYELAAGRAWLTKFAGSEITAHNVVISTPDGAVIVVDGNSNMPIADLKAVAAGLLPQ